MSIKGDTGRAMRTAARITKDGITGARHDPCAVVDRLREDWRSHGHVQVQAGQPGICQARTTSGLWHFTKRRSRTTRITPSCYFYLGNSYDNLYKPSEKGKPENDAIMAKAVDNYALAVEKLDANDPTQAKIKGSRFST